VTDEGVAPVNPKDDPEPGSRFASLYNEAVRRGFQRDDIGFGMKPDLWTDPKFNKIGDPDGKRFEKVVARIHIALCCDAEVKWSEKLTDTSGTERHIDVTIRTRAGPHQMLGIIQCKEEKRPLSISEVEAFVSVKKDLNAATAIVVARNGLDFLGKPFPLERVSIHLTHEVEIEQQRTMKVPLGASYEFRQNTGECISIAERDLPGLKSKRPRD
jgi:hypothetical protein